MDTLGTTFMPPAGSTVASETDALFYFIYYTAAIFFALVVGFTLYFAVRYRRRGKAGLTTGKDHNLALEILWTVVPTVLVFIVFAWGFKDYLRLSVVPKDAVEIKVTAQRWFWSFDYPEGASSVNELVVPAGRPVRLLMSSRDVIHSFFIPNFRIKMDVLPNRYSTAWFEAISAGEFNLFCTEYCGTKHSEMIGKVRVVTEKEFTEWQSAGSGAGEGMSLEEFGAKLYASKACITCHTVDGKPGTGPTFLNVFGKREKFTGGSELAIDENYIRQSILEPQSKIVAGYQPVMPTYQGLLKDRQIDALVAYIRSLKQAKGAQ